MSEYDSKLYTQKESIINGHHVWHYLISTPIGDYHVIQYEELDMTISEKIVRTNTEAEQIYKRRVRYLSR